jgi:hypothetical protein
MMILGLNLSARDASPRLAKGASPPAKQLFMAYQEQQRLLSELIAPREPPVAEPPKPPPPRPRSERRRGLLMA